MKSVIEKIFDYSLEEIMGERFGRYSKYIIQDRAIPDVRDGLKPVQRRILYSMYKEKNTHDKPYRKSAKTVGDVIGNFHPHGDSSIYDAMVRMSQSWKNNKPYIDMHGNNGSIDGDSPAAYRYTEARLSKISLELLKDIDKDVVLFAPNFDDTIMEPTVLPAKFPNLLVNGSNGISAGYATNIPPHNLSEVVDATIKRIDNPNCHLDTILNIIKGPDFPTGGSVSGAASIREALTTGKGRVVVTAKAEFVNDKKNNQIIITEIPFETNKSVIVRKIDEIRVDHKIDGIVEVRDETDKEGLRIAIDVKKDANKDLILNYLYKNTDLQVSYNYNMVAIVNRRPKLLSVVDIIDSYISFQREFIIKRTQFDLDHAKARYHIVIGLIKAISILDEVIRVIRASKNKSDAKDNLVKEFGFTELQAEAIVMLQLYKLTNTDITSLEQEKANLDVIIKGLQKILDDEDTLKGVMKDELRKIKQEYGNHRLTEIKDEIEEIKIDTTDLITKEDVVVLITKDGYVKRTSKRGYLSNQDEPLLKENDYVIGLYGLNTLDTLLVFTSLGNYLYVPVHIIPDIKWKQMGKHISNLIKIEENERIVSAIPVTNFDLDLEVVVSSRLGMIKKTKLNEFKVNRYSKPMSCMKLKDDDEVLSAFISKPEILVVTNSGYALWFDTNEIPLSGVKSSGVKSIKLKDDYVVSCNTFDKSDEYLTVFTNHSTAKRIKLEELEKMGRAHRGLVILKLVKTNPYEVIKTFVTDVRVLFGLVDTDISYIKGSEIMISDRYKTGGAISKGKVSDVFVKIEDILKEEKPDNTSIIIDNNVEENVEVLEEKKEKPVNKQLSLLEIDDALKEIDNILDI